MERLRELLRFDGRLSRIAFWRAYLFLAIAFSLSWCLGLFAILAVGPPGAILLLPICPLLAANVAIAIRRLHDRGKSGWWIIPVGLLPFLAGLGMSAETTGASSPALLALTGLMATALVIWGWVEIGFRRGEAGANRYGEAPQAA